MTAETPENAQLRRRDARNRNAASRKPILFDGKRQKDRRETSIKAGTEPPGHQISNINAQNRNSHHQRARKAEYPSKPFCGIDKQSPLYYNSHEIEIRIHGTPFPLDLAAKTKDKHMADFQIISAIVMIVPLADAAVSPGSDLWEK